MGKRIKEFYISLDIEADGPCPGRNSMLQLGTVFYDFQGNEIFDYQANIEEIEGGVTDPETMKWWQEQEEKNPGLWASMMADRVSPKLAMERFRSHVERFAKALKCSPVVFAYPAGYDFTWLYWYMLTFLGESPVGFSCIDMKTMAMNILQKPYLDSAKRRFPKHWFDMSLKHTHNAVDDAREQGYTFFQMRAELQRMLANSAPIVDEVYTS